ncbi:MAG: glycosyltransferase family 9 protein [Candidatus Scalinduaceae bacterium]
MKSFLICHRGALGDFILTWPALYCLKRELPDYHLMGIGRSEYMRLAINMGLLDSYLDKESTRLLDFFCGRSIPLEIGSPHGDPHGAVLWLREGQEMVNLLKKSASLPVIPIDPFPNKQMHLAHYYCSSIKSHFPITIPQSLSDCFPLRATKGQYALIHPGSGSSKKNYVPQFYLDLADELRRFGYQKVGFVLGPVEQEKMATEEFSGEWIEQPENVEELSKLLTNVSLYIGNDSGVSHLSGYLGIPTIALYKTTDPEIWGVLGRKVVHITAINEKSALDRIRECLKRFIMDSNIMLTESDF